MKAAKQILVCACALILLCVLARFTLFASFRDYIPLPPRGEGAAALELEEEGVLELTPQAQREGFMEVLVKPLARGETFVYLGPERDALGAFYRVDALGTVFNLSNGNYTGDSAVLIGFTLFYLLVSAIMLWHYFHEKGSDFYSYASIYYIGFSVFALVCGLLMLEVTIRHFANPFAYSMMMAYDTIQGASGRFLQLTAPLAIGFALALMLSNLVLLKHERPGLNNALGLVMSVLILGGEALAVVLGTRDISGSETEVRIASALNNSYATIFVYFECMLLGAVVCAVKASRKSVSYDKDYIIILGCAFRRDGTLPPLLRGRVDRALGFWREQQARTGKAAQLIPSGGQGADESMSEAEAMKRYLLSQGVSAEAIRIEGKSENTLQNMIYSKKLIDEAGGGKALFSTTSYHVFRSGVWANRAGLRAEGIGSRTVWWYWPNAFIRECLGLLKFRWKQEILLLIVLLLFYGLLAVIL